MTGRTDKYILGYVPYYEKLIKELPMTEGNMMEIGVMKGHSLQMWAELLPNHKIYGIDFVDMYEYDYHPRIIRDFYNMAILEDGEEFTTHPEYDKREGYKPKSKGINSFKKDYRDTMFDFIVEDASHLIPDQKLCLKHMFEKVAPGGAYIIEDLVTSLHKPQWEKYKCGDPVTTLEMLQDPAWKDSQPDVESVKTINTTGDHIMAIIRKKHGA